MRNVTLHYELPGRIGGKLETESVDAVVDRLQLLKSVVEGEVARLPARGTVLQLGWYQKQEPGHLSRLTVGVFIYSAEKWFKGLVDKIISGGGVPDYVMVPPWFQTIQNVTETFGLVDGILARYGAGIVGDQKKEREFYRVMPVLENSL